MVHLALTQTVTGSNPVLLATMKIEIDLLELILDKPQDEILKLVLDIDEQIGSLDFSTKLIAGILKALRQEGEDIREFMKEVNRLAKRPRPDGPDIGAGVPE